MFQLCPNLSVSSCSLILCRVPHMSCHSLDAYTEVDPVTLRGAPTSNPNSPPPPTSTVGSALRLLRPTLEKAKVGLAYFEPNSTAPKATQPRCCRVYIDPNLMAPATLPRCHCAYFGLNSTCLCPELESARVDSALQARPLRPNLDSAEGDLTAPRPRLPSRKLDREEGDCP